MIFDLCLANAIGRCMRHSTSWRNQCTNERMVIDNLWLHAVGRTGGTKARQSQGQCPNWASTGSTHCTECHWRRACADTLPDLLETGSHRRECTNAAEARRRSLREERPSQLAEHRYCN
jgi:hypothetical protein